MLKEITAILLLSSIFALINPQVKATESKLSELAIDAAASIPSHWHRVMLNGSLSNTLLDAKRLISVMESSGEFRLVAVRKLALPATLALMNAMKNRSTQVGLVLGAIAMLHSGFHNMRLYHIYDGNMNQALREVPHHQAFLFTNLSDSFMPKFVSKIIMLPAKLIDFIIGADNRQSWSLGSRALRWSLHSAYHDGVMWFGFGTGIAAIAGGGAHLLSEGFNDKNTLELFFERI